MSYSQFFDKVKKWQHVKSGIALVYCILCSFSIYALLTSGFARTPVEWLYAEGVAFITDVFWVYYFRKELVFPFSGLIAGLGTFLLLDTSIAPLYGLAAFIAITSKHLFQLNGRHLLNPSNFGVLFISLVLHDMATIAPIRWGGELSWIIVFVLLGTFVTFYVNRWVLSLSFYLFFILFAFVKSLFMPQTFLFLILPLLGPGIQLFIFFMLTDPRTSPDKQKHQVIFSFFVALLDSVFRWQQHRFAPYLALLSVCLIYNFLRFKKLDVNKS